MWCQKPQEHGWGIWRMVGACGAVYGERPEVLMVTGPGSGSSITATDCHDNTAVTNPQPDGIMPALACSAPGLLWRPAWWVSLHLHLSGTCHHSLSTEGTRGLHWWHPSAVPEGFLHSHSARCQQHLGQGGQVLHKLSFCGSFVSSLELRCEGSHQLAPQRYLGHSGCF